jgi:hypothetical protein
MDVQKDFGENERDKGNQHGVELALLAKQPIDPTHLMINRWCCEATSGLRKLVRGVTSPCWLSL